MALATLAVAGALLPSSQAHAAPLLWRLEQPPPPAGVPFNVPLGEPGDLQFWAPNRGLLTVDGNSTIKRGIYYYNGRVWRQLATVCGGPGDTARIAWAGPEEFWVISEPSLPRAGSGLALCHFSGGQVVGSFSTRVEASDPYRVMLSATCNGPDDCWFGGIGSQDAVGEKVGAFHLHWNGSELSTVYGPQGRAVSDMEFHSGKLYESTLVGRSPENRTDPVDLASPEPVPRLIHEVSEPGGFADDPFEPAPLLGVPSDGTELLALDGEGPNLWAVGGGAASGPSAPAESSVARPPVAARLVGGAFQQLNLSGASFGPNDRFGDVAAIPGENAAMATVVPFADRRSVNSKATVARIQADGSTTLTKLPSAGSGRGSAARIACPAPNDCWMVTWAGWLFHYSDESPLPVDEDPAFQGTIDFRPNEAAEQFIPDTLPEDDSQLFAPPPAETEKEKTQHAKRKPPLLKKVRSHLEGLTLTVSFTVTRKAKVQLIAKRAGRKVAQTPLLTFAPGRRALHLRLDRDNYPTALAFKTSEVKTKGGAG